MSESTVCDIPVKEKTFIAKCVDEIEAAAAQGKAVEFQVQPQYSSRQFRSALTTHALKSRGFKIITHAPDGCRGRRLIAWKKDLSR